MNTNDGNDGNDVSRAYFSFVEQFIVMLLEHFSENKNVFVTLCHK